MVIDGKHFSAAIKRVAQLTGCTSIGVIAKNKQLTFCASNDGRTFIEKLPVDTDEDWSCAVALDNGMLRLLNGKVKLTCDGSTVSVTSQSYRGKFPVEGFVYPDLVDFSKAKSFSANHINLLSAGYDATSIRSVFGKTTFEFSFGSGKFVCATWDRVHFALLQATSTLEGAAKMSGEDIGQLLDAVDEPQKFAEASGFLLVQNAYQKFYTPTLQVEANNEFEQLIDFANRFNEPLCEISPHELLLATDRTMGACEQGQSVTLEFGKQKCTVKAKSNKGDYLEVLGISNSKSTAHISVDPSMLIDILSRAKNDDMQVGITDRFIWFAEKIELGTHYLALLSSQE